MAESKVKVENYTAEMTSTMVADYVANPNQATVEKLAEKFNRTTRSIIAKLSREKVYVKKTYTTKAGATPVSKETLSSEIGDYLGMSENDASSLASANKNALRLIAEFIRAEKTADVETFGTDN